MKYLSGLFLSLSLLILGGGLSFYGITYGNEIMGEVAEMPPHFGVGVNLVFLGLICGAIRALLTWLQKRKST
ncbi:hypothetical protein [Shewanella glacialimarina]|jgi:hypothetical protein|uniref:hypothetical protein n=1 Tax=Shewanella glacialimarina TaxID=2590884 RepID=UPI001CF85A62|nr:hypothetical protein [Shewanella glacialimarina]UCX04335.1 hypothetical protein FJ709_07370 [Shewanella glacialimarina]